MGAQGRPQGDLAVAWELRWCEIPVGDDWRARVAGDVGMARLPLGSVLDFLHPPVEFTRCMVTP